MVWNGGGVYKSVYLFIYLKMSDNHIVVIRAGWRMGEKRIDFRVEIINEI